MTIYHVHLYREMRLTFRGVEAEAPEAAAAIARGKPRDEADDLDDCQGEEFAVLVDVAGDEDYRQSVMVDFEAERMRRAAAHVLRALRRVLTAAGDLDAAMEGATDAFDSERQTLARACRIAEAAHTAAHRSGIQEQAAPRFSFTHDPTEDASRAYVLVDNRFDVALVRTDEGLIVDVYPKEGFELLGTLCLWDDQAAIPEAES